MKLITLIRMHLNETYINFDIGKYLFDTFPIQNSRQERIVYPGFNFPFEYTIWEV
jgi:hypothetical protein